MCQMENKPITFLYLITSHILHVIHGETTALEVKTHITGGRSPSDQWQSNKCELLEINSTCKLLVHFRFKCKVKRETFFMSIE